MPNYRPVVQLLVDQAKALGYHPVAVRDEEELYPATGMSTSEIIDAATADDWLYTATSADYVGVFHA